MSMETWRLTILAAALTLVVAIWHNPVPVPDSVFDYCSVPCVNYSLPNQTSGNNTACWYAKCPRQPNVIELPWNFHARNAVLEANNQYRSWLGLEDGAPAQLAALSYDIELEFLMACWLNRGLPQGDQCRSCKRWHYVAQNIIAYDMGDDDPLSYVKFHDLIRVHWAKQIHKAPWINSSTNIACANTTHVGCYAVALNESRRVVLGCNYAPGAGVPNQKMWEAREEARCPNVNKDDSGLKYLCRPMKYWPHGSGYVGNLLLEERKAYWERDAHRIKNGEDDYSTGCTVNCDSSIALTLLYCLCVITKLLTTPGG